MSCFKCWVLEAFDDDELPLEDFDLSFDFEEDLDFFDEDDEEELFFEDDFEDLPPLDLESPPLLLEVLDLLFEDDFFFDVDVILKV